jgi:hypothetical protein
MIPCDLSLSIIVDTQFLLCVVKLINRILEICLHILGITLWFPFTPPADELWMLRSMTDHRDLIFFLFLDLVKYSSMAALAD